MSSPEEMIAGFAARAHTYAIVRSNGSFLRRMGGHDRSRASRSRSCAAQVLTELQLAQSHAAAGWKQQTGRRPQYEIAPAREFGSAMVLP
jgi:hypothetical protein